MTVRTQYVPFAGGVDQISPPTRLDPGRALVAMNYECPVEGGYRSIKGYTQIGNTLPGQGKVLGVAVWDGRQFAIREISGGGTATLYEFTSGSWSSVGTGLPVGRYEIIVGNFYATAASEALFMVCPNGKPYQFDGSTLTEITGAQSGAKFLAVHQNRLALGFEAGSVQLSAVGDPTDWAGANGAAEIGAQDHVTGLSSSTGGVLIIFCDETVKGLYGSATSNYEVKMISQNSGAKPYSTADMQVPFFVNERGPASLYTVQAFGDFEQSNWGRPVEPLFREKFVPHAATVSKDFSQYRVWNDKGLGVWATFSGKELLGITQTQFPDVLEVVFTGEDATGDELILFGDDAGNVYQMDKGTSFAGAAIESFIGLAYNHVDSPTRRKRFRRAYLLGIGTEKTQFSVLPGFDYGDADIARHLRLFRDMPARGGFWDFDDWNDFAWSAPYALNEPITIAGSGENIGLNFYHSSDTADPHRLTGYVLHYSLRRLMRG